MASLNSQKYIVRLRGLPWSATEVEIMEFLDGVMILNGEHGVHRTLTNEGRPTGEAYVEVSSAEDLEEAVSRDKNCMGRRYIEVFKSTLREMNYMLNDKISSGNGNEMGEPVVRLRGLPYNCSKEEIAQFFSGLEIVPNGITLPPSGVGNSNGEAFVEFSSPGFAEQALSKHKERIGHRYIEIFKSSIDEVNQYFEMAPTGRMGSRNRNFRMGPYDRPPMRRGRGSRGNNGGNFGGGRGGRRNYDDGLGDYGDDMDYSYDDYNQNEWGRGNGMKGYGRGRSRNYDCGLDDGLDHGGNRANVRGVVVHMRGLPFRVTEQDVHNFFEPILPLSVEFEYGPDGRVTGEADCIFSTYSDAQRAMQKDKECIQHRYIELFMRNGRGNQGRGGSGNGRRGRGSRRGGYGDGYNNSYSSRGNYKQF